jgi:putative transposase
VKTRYRFRFYPTAEQVITLSRVFGSVRYVYNWALRLRSEAWRTEQKRISYNDTSAMLTTLKKQPETIWLSEVSCVPTQQALRHLQTAFLNFWSKRGRYPTYKKKRNRQSAEYTCSAFKWDSANKNLVLSGLGRLDIHWSKDFTSAPTTITITKEPSGRYYVTLCLDELVAKLPKTGQIVGVDLGVNRLATLSNGERIANPRYLGRNLSKLARLQKRLSRRQKGSHRWHKARVRVARLHEHIANARADTLHKFTTGLVRRFDVIGIEDLNVRGMTANHCLARSIADVGMGMFRRQIEYKCERYGKTLKVVDRFYPSSKTCSVCGHVVESLPLDIREWDCPKCTVHHDRDENAAKNIKSAEGHSVDNARGGDVRQRRASAPRRNRLRSENRPIVDCALHS